MNRFDNWLEHCVRRLFSKRLVIVTWRDYFDLLYLPLHLSRRMLLGILLLAVLSIGGIYWIHDVRRDIAQQSFLQQKHTLTKEIIELQTKRLKLKQEWDDEEVSRLSSRQLLQGQILLLGGRVEHWYVIQKAQGREVQLQVFVNPLIFKPTLELLESWQIHELELKPTVDGVFIHARLSES